MCKDLFLGAWKEKKRWFYTWQPGFGSCFGMLACCQWDLFFTACIQMHMFIHANAFVGDGFRFLGLDLITLNCTLHGSWGFGRKEGRRNEYLFCEHCVLGIILLPVGFYWISLVFLMLVFCFGFQRARRNDVWSSLKDLLTVQKWVMRYYNNSPQTPAPWTPACQTSWPSWRPEW